MNETDQKLIRASIRLEAYITSYWIKWFVPKNVLTNFKNAVSDYKYMNDM